MSAGNTMKIIFWNIQRAGGKARSISTDDLREDLLGLTTQYAPDLIVLCEGAKGLRKQLEANQCIPLGYMTAKLVRTHGTYRKTTTLRYVVVHRSNFAGSFYLIVTSKPGGTPYSRPALAITSAGYCYVALHASSATSSTTPQTGQMIATYNVLSGLIANNTINAPLGIRCIFGDLNMNVRKRAIRGRIRGKFQGGVLGGFSILRSGKPTHRNATTRRYDTELDWALVPLGSNATIQAIESVDPITLSRKRKQDQNDGHVRKKRKRNSDNDWIDTTGDDGDVDDEAFEPTFESTKDPDHKPIMLEF